MNHIAHAADMDSHAEIREEVRKLCMHFPGSYWRELDRQAAYPEAYARALGEGSWLAALIPEAYGGSGLRRGI